MDKTLEQLTVSIKSDQAITPLYFLYLLYWPQIDKALDYGILKKCAILAFNNIQLIYNVKFDFIYFF
jgi:hypothetical protein